MIDEDMIITALFPHIQGPHESLEALVAKLTSAVQKIPATRLRFLRYRARQHHKRNSFLRCNPQSMTADDGTETVHWQIYGCEMCIETPACGYTTRAENRWLLRPARELHINCPECLELLAYVKRADAGCRGEG